MTQESEHEDAGGEGEPRGDRGQDAGGGGSLREGGDNPAVLATGKAEGGRKGGCVTVHRHPEGPLLPSLRQKQAWAHRVPHGNHPGVTATLEPEKSRASREPRRTTPAAASPHTPGRAGNCLPLTRERGLRGLLFISSFSQSLWGPECP